MYVSMSRLRVDERKTLGFVERDALAHDVHEEVAPAGELIVHVLQAVHDEADLAPYVTPDVLFAP